MRLRLLGPLCGRYEATTHLLKLGHRRIAFATTPYYGTTSLEERLEGYRQALNDHGVIFDKNRVYEIEEPDDVQTFLSEAVMTALFAANEHIGTAAIRAAEACGKSVPGQLSVIFSTITNTPTMPGFRRLALRSRGTSRPRGGETAAVHYGGAAASAPVDPAARPLDRTKLHRRARNVISLFFLHNYVG